MKKLYSALGLALAVSTAAFAGVTKDAGQALKLTNCVPTEATSAKSVSEMQKAPAMAPAVSEIPGSYVVGYYEGASTMAGWTCPMNIQIVAGSAANTLTLKGFAAGYNVTANYDAASGSISIPRQFIVDDEGEKLEFGGTPGEYVEFIPYVVRDRAYVSIPALVLKRLSAPETVGWIMTDGAGGQEEFGMENAIYVVEDYGVEGAEHQQCMVSTASIWSQGSGYTFLSCVAMTTFDLYLESVGLSMFNYNADEWTPAGQCDFTDGWVAPAFNTEIPAYKVDIEVNKANNNLVLLKNPYGPNTPFVEANENPNEPGYILLNVENAKCVLVELCVPSGFVSDGQVFYNTTYESRYHYLDGLELEDIILEAEEYGDDLSSFEDGEVFLPNCTFGVTGDILNAYGWRDNQTGQSVAMVSTIVLPEGVGGVNGILNDTNNAAARYFNLQGVEVNAPVENGITIVKRGNEVSKVIR